MTDLEIVQEAQKRILGEIDWYLITRIVITYKPKSRDQESKEAQIQNNGWLAHKAFFDRHKRLETDAGDLCEICEYSEYRASYPCPESVAQAKAIMGVTE